MRCHPVKSVLWIFFCWGLALTCFSCAASRPPAPSGPSSSPGADAPVSSDPGAESSDWYDPFDDAAPSDAVSPHTPIADPLSGFNRAMFVFNDKLYFWVLKPVAIGYRTVMPTPVRKGIKNVITNFMMPIRLVNCLIQGKGAAAKAEVGRFLVNTTYGIGGLFNPAQNYPALNPPDEEDFGQTLGHYGMGNGFYIVWPFMGPSTVRDTLGAIGDWAANPLTIIRLSNADAGFLSESETAWIVRGVDTVNSASFRIGDYEALKEAAIDPYEAVRDAYIQHRNSRIAR
ncbi:VacJ family lipoprotein [Desulfosarcina sp. OttesenSCG-928-A07]|nr:VacJ family lipoprotein [Desulfosarcina sp. OttesenSCG-928-G17]MDL2329225.1 VacJ family lipoprotein [Desulfosarcina sp. OttesenSCG-928-A07]